VKLETLTGTVGGLAQSRSTTPSTSVAQHWAPPYKPGRQATKGRATPEPAEGGKGAAEGDVEADVGDADAEVEVGACGRAAADATKRIARTDVSFMLSS